MSSFTLLSFDPNPPPGFTTVTALRQSDLRRGVCVIDVVDDAGLTELTTDYGHLFPKLSGIILGFGSTELVEKKLGPTLLHLVVPLAFRGQAGNLCRILAAHISDALANRETMLTAQLQLERHIDERRRWGEFTRQSYEALRVDATKYTAWTTTALTALLQFKQLEFSKENLTNLPDTTVDFLLHERFNLTGAALLLGTEDGWKTIARKGAWEHLPELAGELRNDSALWRNRSEVFIPVRLPDDQYVIVISRVHDLVDFSPYELAFFELFATLMASVLASIQLERELQGELVERRETERELERALRTRDAFLANMSHELRTPLNVILGEAQLIAEGVHGDVSEDQSRALVTMAESGQHLLDLINDVLDLSKIEANALELVLSSFEVDTVCRDCLRFLKGAADRKKIKMTLSTDYDVPMIHADKRRVKQILINLINNAIKFTPPDGRVGLEVGADQRQQEVHFTVWDTGIGISPENRKRLFMPFVQIDSRLSREYEGTGLGLTLVSQLAAMHGGRVSLESEESVGSRFTVFIPFVCNRSTAEGLPLDDLNPVTVESVKPDLARTENVDVPTSTNPSTESKTPLRRILVAEDNELNSKMMNRLLQYLGYQVEVVSNGVEALRAITKSVPDLVFMDVQMPVMDGLEATRQIRLRSECASLPIIAMTGLAMAEDRERCLAAGCSDYLSKPINIEMVKTLLAEQFSMATDGSCSTDRDPSVANDS